MSRYLLPLLIAAAVLLAALLAWWTLGRGSGPVSNVEATIVERDVDPFHRVVVSGRAEVILQPGRVGHVRVDTPPRGQRTAAEVKNGTLRIDVRDARRWWSGLTGGNRGRAVRVTVTYPELDTVVLSGAVRLTADTLDTPQLHIEASGGSALRIDQLSTRLLLVEGNGALKAHLGGQATEQHVSISGAAEYDAGGLASDRARVDVSGVGRVVLRVAKTLDASISGAGSVEYYGDPQVRQDISGVGHIRRREATRADARGPHLAGFPLLPGLCAALI